MRVLLPAPVKMGRIKRTTRSIKKVGSNIFRFFRTSKSTQIVSLKKDLREAEEKWQGITIPASYRFEGSQALPPGPELTMDVLRMNTPDTEVALGGLAGEWEKMDRHGERGQRAKPSEAKLKLTSQRLEQHFMDAFMHGWAANAQEGGLTMSEKPEEEVARLGWSFATQRMGEMVRGQK